MYSGSILSESEYLQSAFCRLAPILQIIQIIINIPLSRINVKNANIVAIPFKLAHKLRRRKYES